MLDRPNAGEPLEELGRDAAPLGQVVDARSRRVEQDVQLVGGAVGDAATMSVFITLWMSGMCLSPMPWMLCSPKPFASIVGHSSASTATISAP